MDDETRFLILELPEEIIQQILSKLHIKPFFRSKCVCKTFLDLTSITLNPHLRLPSRNHLMFQFDEPISNLPKSCVHLLDPQYDIFRSDELVEGNSRLPRGSAPLFHLPKSINSCFGLNQLSYDDPPPSSDPPLYDKLAIVNACNHLIYFAVKCSQPLYSLVINPITTDYFVVPRLSEKRPISSMWLGYSPISKRYKIVQFFNAIITNNNGTVAVQDYGGVYTHSLASKSLRFVGYVDEVIHWDNSYAFINGIGYWLWLENHVEAPFIVSFDFHTEKIGSVNAPPCFIANDPNNNKLTCRDWMAIGVVGDCLCLIDNSGDIHDHIDIWMMTIHKGSSSGDWVKKFNFQEKSDYLLRPLCEMNNGNNMLVALDNHKLLLFYVMENGIVLLKLFDDETDFIHVVDFVPTLESMKPIFFPEGETDN